MLKKYGKYLTLGLLGAVVAVSGVSAYFTATDTKTNTFNVEGVDVTLTEPSYTDAQDVTPNETVAKDPTVTNSGDAEQFAFLKVTVPFKNLIVAELDGTKAAAANTELFTWNTEADAGAINAAPGAGTGAINDGWVLVDTQVKTDTVEYYYAYGTDTAMTAIASGTSTVPLFNSVTMCNAIEGQNLEGTALTVGVDVYAIQTNDLGNIFNAEGTVVPAEVLAIYLEQNK